MRKLIGFPLLVLLFAARAAAVLQDVCYSYLGCFSMQSPWYSFIRPFPAPQSPETIDTQFFLYTRAHPSRYQATKLPSVSLAGSDYLGSRPTFFLVQGYISNSQQRWILEMKDALLNEFDGNVFIVDWGKGSTQLNYLQVASNGRVVGAELIRFVRYLLSAMGAATSRFHCIGHSIGAHVCGYVGKAIPGIARITALEAAQPGFEGYAEMVRLTQNDANFVEAIHTNAKPLFPTLGFGYMGQLGHVDYYLNGGADQPHCKFPPTPNMTINSFNDLARVKIDFFVRWIFCSHARAFYIFTESVLNKGCTLWGHRANFLDMSLSIVSGGYLTQYLNLASCDKDNCSPFGLQASIYPARGKFIVKTTKGSPFCIRESSVDHQMSQYKTASTAPV